MSGKSGRLSRSSSNLECVLISLIRRRGPRLAGLSTATLSRLSLNECITAVQKGPQACSSVEGRYLIHWYWRVSCSHIRNMASIKARDISCPRTRFLGEVVSMFSLLAEVTKSAWMMNCAGSLSRRRLSIDGGGDHTLNPVCKTGRNEKSHCFFKMGSEFSSNGKARTISLLAYDSEPSASSS